MAALIVIAVLVVFALVAAARSIRVIPQARAGVVERLGRYSRTLEPGLTIITPFIDRVKPLVDLREQVVNFSPQSVITEDNVVVGIETVLYFTITDPRSATYEIAEPLQAIEQLTVTTLRNVIGGLTLEDTLTARENVNNELRVVLDEATGKWGIRINRVEIKAVDPPPDIRTAMEKQMRAERDRRAAILTAEGQKQAQILTAEGAKQAAVLTAEGDREAAILRAEGEAKAIDTVFSAIHEGHPTRELLSYEYLQMLPQLAQGDANKVFVVPSEFATAFGGIGEALSHRMPSTDAPSPPAPAVSQALSSPQAGAPQRARAPQRAGASERADASGRADASERADASGQASSTDPGATTNRGRKAADRAR
jgi:regulator of protease activity HflC (stomatin/prohibitin superfamily)